MHTFPTPTPIGVDVDLGLGDVHLVAEDGRTDATVEVRPANPDRTADRRDAEATQVACAHGTLTVRTPKRLPLFGKGGAVEVIVTVPSGADVNLRSGMGRVTLTGRFGDCRIKTALGDIRAEDLGTAHLVTGMGDVTADTIAGDASVQTGSGAVRVAEVTGGADIKNGNGPTWVGAVGGRGRIRASNGDIAVDHAGDDIDVRSACGDIRLHGVVQGEASLATAAGALDIGIAEGTAAWLDVSSQFGNVTSTLDAAGEPGPGDRTVAVRARTSYGDITVRRG